MGAFGIHVKPANKAELITHWRATATEIRAAITALPDLDDATKSNAESTVMMLEKCADQLESILTH